MLTDEISNPTPNVGKVLSIVSLVRLFLISFVATFPRGDLTANDLDDLGLSSKLSLSNWG